MYFQKIFAWTVDTRSYNENEETQIQFVSSITLYKCTVVPDVNCISHCYYRFSSTIILLLFIMFSHVLLLLTGNYYQDILILGLQGKWVSIGLLVSHSSFWESLVGALAETIQSDVSNEDLSHFSLSLLLLFFFRLQSHDTSTHST